MKRFFGGMGHYIIDLLTLDILLGNDRTLWPMLDDAFDGKLGILTVFLKLTFTGDGSWVVVETGILTPVTLHACDWVLTSTTGHGCAVQDVG